MKTIAHNPDQAKAKLIGNIIVAICAIAALAYMAKGITMQVIHFWGK